MIYQNPIIRGFNPDPSICAAEGKYYLVTSSFQFFPGVPIYESEDLVNWKKIGHVLTRHSQVHLENVPSSGGVFAATIRYYQGRYYMTTTNNSTRQHFIVWTDDVYGEWSEPVVIDQDGIDPSLLFDQGKVYFTSNGEDDYGVPGIVQCEIDIASGKKLTPSKTIWQGTGGRYLEGPHLYHIGNDYYIFASEGGTEYGHMITYARSKHPYGPFEPYQHNPILTNRNLGGFDIQAVGHGDLVQDKYGDWFMIHLGFRQIGRWLPFHHLGRETFLTPVFRDEDGWFTAGHQGTTIEVFEKKGEGKQTFIKHYMFNNIDTKLDWYYLRKPLLNHYNIHKDHVILHGSNIHLNQPLSPTFIGLKQAEFNAIITCDVTIDHGEGGLVIYMDENHHYDLLLQEHAQHVDAIAHIKIGSISHIQNRKQIKNNHATLVIVATPNDYTFYVGDIKPENLLANMETRYVSSEVALGFTGVFIGLYAYGKEKLNTVKFERLTIDYQ